MSAQDALRLLAEADACRDRKDLEACQDLAEKALSCFRGLLDAKGEAGAWRRVLGARLGRGQVTATEAREMVKKEMQRMGERPGPKALLLLSLAEVDLLLGRVDSALAAGQEAQSLFAGLNDVEMQAYTCHAVVAHAYLVLARPDEALEAANKAVSLAQNCQSKSEEAKSWQAVGAARLAVGSNDALAAMERALVLYKELGKKHAEVGLLTMLADSEAFAGKVDLALSHGLDALALARELQAPGYETPALDVLFRIASRAPREAQKVAKDKLSSAAAANDQQAELAGVALMIGVHHGQQNVPAALELAQSTAKKLSEKGDEANLARMLAYVANFSASGDALQAAQRSLKLFQSSGDLSGQGMVKQILDRIYSEKQQCFKAPGRNVAKQALARFGSALRERDSAAFLSSMKCLDGYMGILHQEEIAATIHAAMAEDPDAAKDFLKQIGLDGKPAAPAENNADAADPAQMYAKARSSGITHGPKFRTMCSSFKKGDDDLAMGVLQRQKEEMVNEWGPCLIQDSLLEATVFHALQSTAAKKAAAVPRRSRRAIAA